MRTQMVLFLPPAQMFYRSNDWAPAVHFDCNFNYLMWLARPLCAVLQAHKSTNLLIVLWSARTFVPGAGYWCPALLYLFSSVQCCSSVAWVKEETTARAKPVCFSICSCGHLVLQYCYLFTFVFSVLLSYAVSSLLCFAKLILLHPSFSCIPLFQLCQINVLTSGLLGWVHLVTR